MAYDPNKPLDPNAQKNGSIFSSAMDTPDVPKTTAAPSSIVGQAQVLDKPAAWTVTDDQTVEGRINRIINQDSQFMTQARTRAQEQANARGLANSSLAVSAGESAAYDAALPIAQSDAATFAKAAGYNADQSNQFAVRNQDAQNQFGLANLQNQHQKDLSQQESDQAVYQANKRAESEAWLATINRDTQVLLKNMDSAQQQQAAVVQQQHQKLLETNSRAAEAFSTAMSAVNNIQNNAQMDANTKTQAIAQVWRDVQVQLKVLGSVASLDLTSQLNFANYPGFDAQGQYVGFEPAGNTVGAPAPAPSPGSAPAPAGSFPDVPGGTGA